MLQHAEMEPKEKTVKKPICTSFSLLAFVESVLGSFVAPPEFLGAQALARVANWLSAK